MTAENHVKVLAKNCGERNTECLCGGSVKTGHYTEYDLVVHVRNNRVRREGVRFFRVSKLDTIRKKIL